MKTLFNSKSIVGRVLIVSLLSGGLVFAGTIAVNMFVPTPTEVSNCCRSVDQVTTSDSNVNSSETGRCCVEIKNTLTVSSSSCCTHANCPGGSCSCGGASKTCKGVCGTCSCSLVCDKGNFGCGTQGGTCTKNP